MRIKEKIQRRVLRWYATHRRDLPWRKTRDPYKILVSEVMLQQTQVERVLPKYREFLKKFPTARVLAAAPTAEVIRAWKGLGYNRRALYVQKAAQAVVRDCGGRFPRDSALLKQLPGVGEYTSRAILAFAYGEPVPVLDTNHRRFYQRVLFGTKPKADSRLLKAAEKILPKRRAWDWNQALMDFGSLVCLTGRPKCEECPIRLYCKAFPRLQRSGLRLLSKKTMLKSATALGPLRREASGVLPEVGKVRKQKSIPFQQTDRYFRGRIMDLLREHGRVRMSDMREAFDGLPEERLQKIFTGLARDGLVRMQKNSILLP